MTAAVLLAAALLLGLGAVGHLRHRRILQAALTAHAVFPAGVRARLVAPLIGVEVLAALAGAYAASSWLRAGSGVAQLIGVGLAALFGGYTAYALVAWRKAGTAGIRVPCGCGVGEADLTGWTAARAGLLAAGLLVASAADGGPRPAGPEQVALVFLAGVSLAALAAVLPAARVAPAPRGHTLSTVGGGS